jgi:DNA-binding beta-propeller fold protein YncE
MKQLQALAACAALLLAASFGLAQWRAHAAAPAETTRDVPMFAVDSAWPKMPNGWTLAQVSMAAVDADDNVWVLQRPVTAKPGTKSGPPVLEFDKNGNYLQGWGGPGEGYDWPAEEHGISIDYKGNVWIVGNWNDDQILKFTKSGKFLMQIGHGGKKKTNADTEDFWMPATAVVYPKTNELFVADGYGNRRVIVLDADTGKFKRMWGAFGNAPTDIPPLKTDARTNNRLAGLGAEQFMTEYFLDGGKVPTNQEPDAEVRNRKPIDPNDPGPPQFNLVHDLKISKDGLVYVADRKGLRVQVFTIAGKFVKQAFVDRWCGAGGEAGCGSSPQTAGSVDFSSDPEQRFLYIGSRTPGRIWIYDRKTLTPLASFGRSGVGPGEFIAFHELAADSKGNIYACDLGGSRITKFTFKGIAKKPAAELPIVETLN